MNLEQATAKMQELRAKRDGVMAELKVVGAEYNSLVAQQRMQDMVDQMDDVEKHQMISALSISSGAKVNGG